MATVNFIRYKEQSAGALKGVAEYVVQAGKTWDDAGGMRLVSGQNCSPQFACREFKTTRSTWHKNSPVWFYHYTQSFHPDENIDGATAHQIAQEFAAQAWPDSEVLIATHVDADHIHSHFVVNAVCHGTGKMLRQGPGTLARLRGISDGLCQARGLSVLPPQKPKSQGMTGREYRSAAKGESWKFQTMNAIDQCMKRAANREEFICEMECLGYSVRWEPGRQNITYTHPNGKMVRDRKLHEEKYWKERMEHEFAIRQQIIAGGIEAAQLAAWRAGCAAWGAVCTDENGSRADGLSNGGGVAETAPNPMDDGRGAGGADRHFRGAVPVPDCAPPVGADPDNEPGNCVRPKSDGAGTEGTDGDPSAAGAAGEGTGWEEARAAFFGSLSQNQPAAPIPGLAFSAADIGSAVGAVVRLGRALERTQPSVYVTRPHSESKTLRREREKKIAAGHKPDDHEEYTIEQTL